MLDRNSELGQKVLAHARAFMQTDGLSAADTDAAAEQLVFGAPGKRSVVISAPAEDGSRTMRVGTPFDLEM